MHMPGFSAAGEMDPVSSFCAAGEMEPVSGFCTAGKMDPVFEFCAAGEMEPVSAWRPFTDYASKARFLVSPDLQPLLGGSSGAAAAQESLHVQPGAGQGSLGEAITRLRVHIFCSFVPV